MTKNRVRTCSFRNCKEKYYAKGLCKYHYERSPEVIEKRRESDRKYRQGPDGKAKAKAWELTPKAKATRKKYNLSHKESILLDTFFIYQFYGRKIFTKRSFCRQRRCS